MVLVPSPPGTNIIKNKWVYTIKLKLDKTLEIYKFRVVAKGYKQIEGIDYTKICIPFIKLVWC